MGFYIALLMASIYIVGSIVHHSIKNGISPMPTSNKAKHAIFSLLPDINGKIYELGSGWGTLAFPLAKYYPKSQVIALESSSIPLYLSKFLQTFIKRPNLVFLRNDFFDVDLGNAQLIVCYLYPGAMLHLKDKFERELSPGTYIISNTFAIPEWKPLKVIETNDLYHSKVYLYKV